MKISGWKYYNHAAIPTSAPHEQPNLAPVKDGSIWKLDGKPLFIRYSSNWDCGENTGWWYLIKEAPFDLNALSSNSRKHIKEAYRKTKIEKIDPVTCVESLFECSHNAFLKYKSASNEPSFENFKNQCLSSAMKNIEYWAGFDLVTDKLIGWLNVACHDSWVEIVTAKFDPEYLKLRVSDALYATVLGYYLNDEKKLYVSSGCRSISHETNTQEYKEQHFGYRKAFCKLNIVYSSKMGFFVKILYPLRLMIDFAGKFINKFHLISSVLKMEKIARMSR